VWDNRWWDDILHCYRVDEITVLAYFFVRCIFDKKTFSEEYKLEIYKRKALLGDDDLRKLLEPVFGKYYSKLYEMALNGNLDQVIEGLYRCRV